jgi:hypothetical protein
VLGVGQVLPDPFRRPADLDGLQARQEGRPALVMDGAQVAGRLVLQRHLVM